MQTCALQLDLALAASAPHFVNLASQRLAQTSAVTAPEEPDVPEVPAGVEDVVDEQPIIATAKDAMETKEARPTTVENESREKWREVMQTCWRNARNPSLLLSETGPELDRPT